MNKYQEALKAICFGCDDYVIGGCEPKCCKLYVPIKELIDKEEPHKPMIESDGDWNGEPVYDTWVCPNCETKYEMDFDHYDYCPNCGQHIDWREEEIDDD